MKSVLDLMAAIARNSNVDFSTRVRAMQLRYRLSGRGFVL